MANDTFLILKDIGGESKDSAYAGEIDVSGWEWGLSQTGSSHSGGGAGAGKVNVDDIRISKYVDKSSANLMLYCAKGNHIEEGKLICRKAGGEQLEYLVITMKKIMVSEVTFTGTSADDRLTEELTLNFAEITVEYAEQADDGTGAAAVTFGWNIEQNIEV